MHLSKDALVKEAQLPRDGRVDKDQGEFRDCKFEDYVWHLKNKSEAKRQTEKKKILAVDFPSFVHSSEYNSLSSYFSSLFVYRVYRKDVGEVSQIRLFLKRFSMPLTQQ